EVRGVPQVDVTGPAQRRQAQSERGDGQTGPAKDPWFHERSSSCRRQAHTDFVSVVDVVRQPIVELSAPRLPVFPPAGTNIPSIGRPHHVTLFRIPRTAPSLPPRHTPGVSACLRPPLPTRRGTARRPPGAHNTFRPLSVRPAREL